MIDGIAQIHLIEEVLDFCLSRIFLGVTLFIIK